ncbi:hypothetical protein PILCRDRAFT_814083 [Piloderma croceum F 1598]|uniref:Ricin B lectin domain-containing protein n=1 Tax=Piloderma croceum (strain F 1598) TaxID=765440 RepID=A0A0C3BNX4_PILCF|nr:hypothetical protein PILCRDRAFT_814083 [Piloderma croceum F 1598]
MAPLDTGRYIITNCLHKRVAILPNATQYSTIVGGTQAQNSGEMWNVGLLSSGAYKIQNYGHGSFANGENGFLAKRGDGIVGGTHPQQWKIIEMPSKGEYCICPVVNVDICWSLVDNEPDYPIILGGPSTSRHNQWTFTRVSHVTGAPIQLAPTLAQRRQAEIEAQTISEDKRKAELEEKLGPEIKENIEKDEISRAEEVERKTLRKLLADKAEERRRVEVELMRKGNTKKKKMEAEDPLTVLESMRRIVEEERLGEEVQQVENQSQIELQSQRSELLGTEEEGEPLAEEDQMAEEQRQTGLEIKLEEKLANERRQIEIEAKVKVLEEKLANEERKAQAVEIKHEAELESQRRDHETKVKAMEERIQQAEGAAQMALITLAEEREKQRAAEQARPARVAEEAERKRLGKRLAKKKIQPELEMKRTNDDAKQSDLEDMRKEARRFDTGVVEKHKAKVVKHKVGHGSLPEEQVVIIEGQEDCESWLVLPDSTSSGGNGQSSSRPKTRCQYSWKKAKLWCLKSRSSGSSTMSL